MEFNYTKERKICPIMGRQPRGVLLKLRALLTGKEVAIFTGCQEGDCAWWNDKYECCSVKGVLTNRLAAGKIY